MNHYSTPRITRLLQHDIYSITRKVKLNPVAVSCIFVGNSLSAAVVAEGAKVLAPRFGRLPVYIILKLSGVAMLVVMALAQELWSTPEVSGARFVYVRLRMLTHARAHARARTPTHTHTYTHTHTHKQTQTHCEHVPPPLPSYARQLRSQCNRPHVTIDT
jgi:hypothetical protein